MLHKENLRNKWWLFTLVVIPLLSGPMVLADGQESEKHNQSIKEISKEIAKITKNLNANKALLKSERDKLSEIEREIQQSDNTLSETISLVKTIEAKLLKLDERKKALNLEHANDLEAYRAFVKNQYMNGRANYLKMVLNQKDPYAVGRLNNYFEYFQKDKTAKLLQIKNKLDDLSAVKESQTISLRDLALAREKQTQVTQKLEATRKRRNQTIEKLNTKVESSNSRLGRLKKDRKRLDNLIKEIAIQARRLKEKEEAARVLEQQRASATTPKPNRTPVKRELVQGGFTKQKGRLNYPVDANIKYGFGARVPESGMRAQGMFFSTQGGRPVRSIFRGRVLFADYLKGYGLMLIIDHGDEHISLYGHNDLLYKKVGDMVDTNEVVSTSGVSGGLKSAGVYFEIRKNASPVNPATWCR